MPEREVKLRPDPGFRLPPLDAVAPGVIAQPVEIIEQRAAYFDTEDLRLSRAGASLRFRDPDGWTVKLPTAGEGTMLVRGEHTFTGPGGASPPAAAVDLVRAWVRTAALHPVARLKTRRRRIELRGSDGKPVAEVVDDEVSVLDGGRITARFREVEVELAEGAPTELADTIVRRLQVAGAGAPDPTPKIVRALGMRALAPPDVAVPDDVGDHSSAGEVIRAAIAASVHRLLVHDPGVRLGDDPEEVHQARVATRRLRSDLRTFAPLLDPDWNRPLRDELKWLGAELGAVRDTEVLLELLRGKAAELGPRDAPIAARLLRRLEHRWEDQRVELLEAMRSDRYAVLLDRLVEATVRPGLVDAAGGPAVDLLPALARKPWRHLKRDVEALAADPPDEQLHAVRIRAKRARYAAEAVAPALGKAARRFAKAVAGLQDVLGDHQDAVVATQWLRDAAADTGAPEDEFVAGMLAGFLRPIELSTRAAWPAAWKNVLHHRLRDG